MRLIAFEFFTWTRLVGAIAGGIAGMLVSCAYTSIQRRRRLRELDMRLRQTQIDTLESTRLVLSQVRDEMTRLRKEVGDNATDR